jgi:tellurite resistance protein
MTVMEGTLLDKVARSLAAGEPTSPSAKTATSILSLAAGSYGLSTRISSATVPTGFDPRAAALFEAIVEAAFVVANADGHFDDAERRVFQEVVVHACGGTVSSQQVDDLLSDLGDQLEEDGSSKRLRAVASVVFKDEHKLEVLRIAALLAGASDAGTATAGESGGVSDSERDALGQLARAFGLGDDAVATALESVKKALA